MRPLPKFVVAAVLMMSGSVLAEGAPTTPPKGSKERQQIMDVLRERVRRLSGQSVTFRVDTLRVSGDWAWAVVQPIDSGGKPLSGGGIAAVLTRQDASQQMGWTVSDTLCRTPSCPSVAVQYAHWVENHEVPATMFEASATPAEPVADGYTVPDKGDPLRQAILDPLRRMIKKGSSLDVVFVVNVMRVSGDYAWVSVAPHAVRGSDAYEPLSALMIHRTKGWEELHQLGCDDPDDDCWDLPTQVQLWKEDIPALPLQIFPLN